MSGVYPASEGAWLAAFMLATGVREVRIPDEWVAIPRDAAVLRYRDERTDETVFRLVERGNDVIDGEEASGAALELEAS